MRSTFHPTTVNRVWLLALVPYMALSLTASFPQGHRACGCASLGQPCLPVALDALLRGGTPSVQIAGPRLAQAPCPLCQWQSTSKLPILAPVLTTTCVLQPVDTASPLVPRLAVCSLAAVVAARAPPAVHA